MLIKRRNVIGSLGGLAMLPMLVETLNAEETAGNNILVVLYLQGGNDGLNTVVPLGQYGHYYKLRTPGQAPTVNGVSLNMAYSLDDLSLLAFDPNYQTPALSATTYAFAPSMVAMRDLYATGKLAILNAVGLPLAEVNALSHSNATMDWMTGQINIGLVQPLGWLGQTLDAVKGGTLGAAASFGGTAPVLIGARTNPMVISPPMDYFDAHYGTSDSQTKLAAAFKAVANNPPAYRQGAADAKVLETALNDIGIVQGYARHEKATTYPTPSWLDYQLRDIGRLIAAGSGVRGYFAAQGSYDTHGQQMLYQPTLLSQLGEAIVNFYEYLSAQGVARNVIVMTISDFGRRPYANLDFGTDHGAAAVSFVFGDQVKGGVYGNYPSLSKFDPNGNLKVTLDFRNVLSDLITHMGGNPVPILGTWPSLGFV
jgi:uncharacterized protein (DUF1501 family)